MQQPISSWHRNDANDNPAGGETNALGLNIVWQDGPLMVDGVRKEPNGCFVETVIAAAIDRLEYYQASKFNCKENAVALSNLYQALMFLNERTKDREARNVEGTHQL